MCCAKIVGERDLWEALHYYQTGPHWYWWRDYCINCWSDTHGVKCFVYEIVLVLDRFFFPSLLVLYSCTDCLFFSFPLLLLFFYLNAAKWPIFGTLAFFFYMFCLIIRCLCVGRNWSMTMRRRMKSHFNLHIL